VPNNNENILQNVQKVYQLYTRYTAQLAIGGPVTVKYCHYFVTVSTSSPGRVSVGGHQYGMQDMAWEHQHPVPLSEMSVTTAPALANIGSAGSTQAPQWEWYPSTSSGGSPNSEASAGASVNAPTPAVAPTETSRTAVTA